MPAEPTSVLPKCCCTHCHFSKEVVPLYPYPEGPALATTQVQREFRVPLHVYRALPMASLQPIYLTSLFHCYHPAQAPRSADSIICRLQTSGLGQGDSGNSSDSGDSDVITDSSKNNIPGMATPSARWVQCYGTVCLSLWDPHHPWTSSREGSRRSSSLKHSCCCRLWGD